MQETIDILNFYLALGGVATFLGAILLIFDVFTSKTLEKIVRLYGTVVAFLLTASTVIISLVYSEVFGFIPCGLCWFQRIFLYPQAIILAMAIYTKDKVFPKYGIALSIPGVIVSLYQHYLQMGGAEIGECPAAGEGADCAERILFEFGFMTFPLLSASLFLFLIVIYFYIINTDK